MKAIAAQARAPFGSIYHFFPGGKDELAAEVIRAGGNLYAALIPLYFDAQTDVTLATGNAFRGAAENLRASNYADACPIATVAMEVASVNETLRRATADAFGLWRDLLGERYAAAGLAPAVARNLALGFLANLEGGFVLARALRSTAPLEVAGATMVGTVEAALRAAQSPAAC
jgi:AcrR family transcriptional regulator